MSATPTAETSKSTAPDWKAICAAHERIAPHIHRTPVLTSASLDQMAGAKLFFKCENLQKTGSFKIRGATNKVFSLTAEEVARGVVTHSSGNHAAARIERETGAVMIHPYEDNRIIAGQATAAKELLEEIADLDALLAPVSGGGLLSGTALAAKHIRPGIRVIGCEPEKADDAYRSMTTGRLQTIERSDTIADGLRAGLAPRTFDILRRNVDAIVLVSEEEIISAMKMVWERMKTLIEPSSAVPVAPLLRRCGLAALGLTAKKPGDVPRIGIILSGGNVDLGALPFSR